MILVTGADGFIGSHLVDHLVRSGKSVRAFVLYNSLGSQGWIEALDPRVRDGLEVVAGDIRDSTGVREALRGCEAVAHLAALIGIPYSYRSPESYLETNVRGTLNVVQAARDLGLRRVVHTSTSEVYGTARFVPMDESHPLSAQSPYAASKIAADQMALSFHRSFGTPVTVIRPFNTFGPRQSARAVIPTVISQLARGDRVVSLGSLEPTRDFSFVRDTAAGMALALEADAAVGEVVNLGSGFEISIGDLVALIGEVMASEVEIRTDPARLRPSDSEVERLCCDPGKAFETLGWKPELTGLDGLRLGLERTAEWFADPANSRGYKPDLYNV